MTSVWGGDLIKALQDKAVIPMRVRRVIIDCPQDDFVTIHIEGSLDETALELVPALVLGATVIENFSSTLETKPDTVAARPIDPEEIPF